MRRGEREEEKRGEAGARQGSRMGVLIKKTQIAAQQMIFFFSSTRHKTVVGGDRGLLEIFGAELISPMQVQEGRLKS